MDFGGIVREVNLALVPEVAPGDYVLVHVGLALSRVDEEEALRTLEYFRRIDELAAEELGAPPPPSVVPPPSR